MAEVLGAAASIVAVIQISEQVISACWRYYTTIKDAKKNIINIITVVSDFKRNLDNLRLLLNTKSGLEDSQLQFIKCVDQSLKACDSALHTLAMKLGITPCSRTDRVIDRLKEILTWPWEEKEIAKALQSIKKHTANINLAMTGDTLLTSLASKESVEDVSESIHAMTTSQRIRNILNWLNASDPTTNHNAAREKHEPTTGNWLLLSDPFVSWTKGKITSLWLHGIPGVGKTILCSTAIEEIDALCDTGSSCRYAYFYFDFNDPNKRTVDGMLRSMITQLSVHNGQLQETVEKLYQQCDDGRQQPAKRSIVKTFLLLLESSDSNRIYLLMDALDECLERDKLLDIIGQIVQQNINLLITSRKERDITERLAESIEVTIDLKGDGIDADIALRVHKCLECDKRLRKWPLKIKQQILNALVKKADGM
jgi:hypothetical protein